MIKQDLPPRQNRVLRTARDFLLGLGLFAILFSGANYLPSRAANEPVPIFTSGAYAAVQLAAVTKTSQSQQKPSVRAADDATLRVILALAFSSLVALNLAFLRHLRRVYASPR